MLHVQRYFETPSDKNVRHERERPEIDLPLWTKKITDFGITAERKRKEDYLEGWKRSRSSYRPR